MTIAIHVKCFSNTNKKNHTIHVAFVFVFILTVSFRICWPIIFLASHIGFVYYLFWPVVIYSGLLLATFKHSFKHGSSCSINTSDELQELLGRHGSKVLHSSKEALLVTKKQYLRKDWCRTEPLVHEVKEEGCAPASVLNNFCYGQCNSFFIPRGSRRKVRLTHF